MSSFSSLRIRLVGTVFIAVAPAWVIMYYTHVPWVGFLIGLVSLVAAWLGGERFILKQVSILHKSAQQLASGDFSSRTGLSNEKGELGELARTFDNMAEALDQRVQEREIVEQTLLSRSFQQTVVGALGQFALLGNDLNSLFDQAVTLVAQTLEVDYCQLLELMPSGYSLRLRTGVGWDSGCIGKSMVTSEPASQGGYTLAAGEPVVVRNLAEETRFGGAGLLNDHGIVSGVTVAIAAQGKAFGVLGAHSAEPREFTEDEVQFLLAIATLLAMAVQRKRSEADLEKLASFAQLNPTPAMELSVDGAITYANPAVKRLATSMGQKTAAGILPGNIAQLMKTCLNSEENVLEMQSELSGRTLSWSFYPVVASKVVHGYVEDITERLNLEAQLRQSQKMESVGQLAAGVAHDFNNMLTVIQGHAGLLGSRSHLAADVTDGLQAIFSAAERAAGLTRQLLMFSRKNVMQPRLLDLRELMANLSRMLQRLLGETINLEFHAPKLIPLILADEGMIEQVMMNLAVNARDAMSKGGSLRVSTSSVRIDEAYVARHREAREGDFVCLRVSDTGCGMDAATMTRIFEPFFTTKEVGKGTGLGLATVYGIVKQHEGWMEVSSVEGKGTTFNVIFPARSEPVDIKVKEKAPVKELQTGEETIMVVEDEPVLREMAQMILSGCGYQVLEASSGVEALRIWEKHQSAIDLVLTDMVMPEGISGMDLAEQLHATKPEVKIIIASGYSMDNLDTVFVRQGHAAFLQKPYTHVTLANAVRESLDR